MSYSMLLLADLACLLLVSLGWRNVRELDFAMRELGFNTRRPEVRDAIMARARLHG